MVKVNKKEIKSVRNNKQMRHISKDQEFKRKVRRKKGALYIGNLPHGFYERGLKGFFRQFGVINRVKVVRSQKNAAPVGYAFIEFAHEEVAKVAAETMHGYILFDKVLKCRVIDGIHSSDKLFANSNLAPETCTRTINKITNQKQLMNVNDEDKRKTKQQKKLQKAENFLRKMLGVDKSTDLTGKVVLNSPDSQGLGEATSDKGTDIEELQTLAYIETNELENDNSSALVSQKTKSDSCPKNPKLTKDKKMKRTNSTKSILPIKSSECDSSEHVNVKPIKHSVKHKSKAQNSNLRKGTAVKSPIEKKGSVGNNSDKLKLKMDLLESGWSITETKPNSNSSDNQIDEKLSERVRNRTRKLSSSRSSLKGVTLKKNKLNNSSKVNKSKITGSDKSLVTYLPLRDCKSGKKSAVQSKLKKKSINKSPKSSQIGNKMHKSSNDEKRFSLQGKNKNSRKKELSRKSKAVNSSSYSQRSTKANIVKQVKLRN